MKGEVFYGKGMQYIKEDNPDLYEALVELNEVVYNGKSLDYKTQKLIAIGIAASKSDELATQKQMKSSIEELDTTKDEIMDVLRVVLLTSGAPAFNQGVRILKSL
ncbi:carboxymuconolactone decarboxylase family protein [Methanobrevibacter sp. OttesenSCG-928-I08]|nr:carboxymuconolactone decarboxylase family protein [Methanobrevibacter sp. OttesenSCG-928-I08]